MKPSRAKQITARLFVNIFVLFVSSWLNFCLFQGVQIGGEAFGQSGVPGEWPGVLTALAKPAWARNIVLIYRFFIRPSDCCAGPCRADLLSERTDGMTINKSLASSSLAEVIDRILDKGVVIDAFIRIALVGIELIAIEVRAVIASVETYLRYAEAVGLTTDAVAAAA